MFHVFVELFSLNGSSPALANSILIANCHWMRRCIIRYQCDKNRCCWWPWLTCVTSLASDKMSDVALLMRGLRAVASHSALITGPIWLLATLMATLLATAGGWWRSLFVVVATLLLVDAGDAGAVVITRAAEVGCLFLSD